LSELVLLVVTTVPSDSVATTPSTPPVDSANGWLTLTETLSVPEPLRPLGKDMTV
jgi:hypothetical protein